MITAQNFTQEAKNVNWSDLPKDFSDMRSDIEEALEFYDIPEMKAQVDDFIETIKPYYKKPASKKESKSTLTPLEFHNKVFKELEKIVDKAESSPPKLNKYDNLTSSIKIEWAVKDEFNKKHIHVPIAYDKKPNYWLFDFGNVYFDELNDANVKKLVNHAKKYYKLKKSAPKKKSKPKAKFKVGDIVKTDGYGWVMKVAERAKWNDKLNDWTYLLENFSESTKEGNPGDYRENGITKYVLPKKEKKPKAKNHDYSILKNYGFVEDHPLMILDKKSPQFAKAFEDFLKEVERDGEKSKDGDWELMKKPKSTPKKKTAKKSTKTSTKKTTSKKVAKTDVEHYNKMFLLLRRFKNFIAKDKVTFRQARLIYMAFNKSAVDRKVRKANPSAELFKKANDAITKLFKSAENNYEQAQKHGIEIEIENESKYQDIIDFTNSRQVNISVRLLKRYISMQGTKPEVAKVKALIKAIDNAIKKNNLSKNNRLYSQVTKAKSELKEYLKNQDEPVDVTPHGLSKPVVEHDYQDLWDNVN